jgi:hypothetical protein
MSTRPELPKPTYWPFFFALAMTTFAWGLITSWIVTGVGGAVLLVSTVGWMKEVSK